VIVAEMRVCALHIGERVFMRERHPFPPLTLHQQGPPSRSTPAVNFINILCAASGPVDLQ